MARPDDARADDRPAGGTLVVNAKGPSGAAIDDGTVMVDEEPRGKLAGGTLKVKRIAEGRHTVAIEAGGYRRFEDTVTVEDGEPASPDAVLRDKAAPPSSHRTAWTVSLGASVAVTVAATAYVFYSSGRTNAHLASDVLRVMGEGGAALSSADCGKTKNQILAGSTPKVTDFNFEAFDRACTWRTRAYESFGLAAVGAIGAVVSLILLTRDTGPPEPPATTGRGTKPAVAIAPVIAPDGGGASLSFTW